MFGIYDLAKKGNEITREGVRMNDEKEKESPKSTGQ